jgi:murein DD-endopeptidase MepM/ murein hydrolase activator NlpD
VDVRRAAIALSCLWAIGAASLAHADRVYKWTDRNGVVHYGDRPPEATADTSASKVSIIPVRAEPGAMVRLRVEQREDAYEAWADNALYGPIEVMLHFSRSQNMAGEPALPARATVPPLGRVLVSRLHVRDPGQGGQFELRLEGVPGDPRARPVDTEYLVPLRQSQGARIDQGYGGRYSHTGADNRYALDFAAAEGTPVQAARGGVVMQVESDFDQAGLNLEKYGGRANFVRILHDDGTMALYAHLQLDGVLVRVGQRVRAGQQIGVSGNTGFTTGPHLHFAVQVNRGMKLVSIPFRLRHLQSARRRDDTPQGL